MDGGQSCTRSVSEAKERRSNFGNQLSGGEQQMLGDRPGTTLNPRVLLLDEPTEGLAPIIVEELLGVSAPSRAPVASARLSSNKMRKNSRNRPTTVVILERGAIVHDAASAALKADPGLERYLGVAGKWWTTTFVVIARSGSDEAIQLFRILDCFAIARNDETKITNKCVSKPIVGSKNHAKNKSPFRADEVGSLLRPPKIKEARAKPWRRGRYRPDDLRKIEI